MIQIHATTVAINGKGLVILGPSGSGKSSVALQLMAVGALLVADDRTDLRLSAGRLIAQAPHPLLGKIEARGVGILQATPSAPVPVTQACDLGHMEEDRLPQLRHQEWLGIRVPLVSGPYRSHLYAALRQLMLGHRLA
ncbi:HPr kinase/phosphorylase [Paracoccus sp. JM45]|uniref:HPr kinase/phosphorylase n=1 Tax=Paracoccus sp. JM45 TaxID=2283626 RepID=UPI0021057BB0|nr:HPr kinase/phosphatase C-terminal domain-containing protein [Paracoccus sp. JM45]